MRIINIIDNFTKVNFGIWNAAISTASILQEKYNIESELWYPQTDASATLDNVVLVPLSDLSIATIGQMIASRKLDPKDCIIITHGCWQYATRWGAEFKKKGYKWMYVPHGMLEPWSVQQKKWKKKIYYSLVEHRLSKKADIIRAVGSPELKNLIKHYHQTILIPNGIEETNFDVKTLTKPTCFLFMARLHHKKGILPLIQAWIDSKLHNNNNYQLNIAGPDDGEKDNMLSLIKENNSKNIHYKGAVYGKEKEELLYNSHFYILPSQSEGFPTSVLEAMQYGLIPIITEGCNFPEALENNKAIQISTNKSSIMQGLQKAIELNDSDYKQLSQEANHYINQNYSLQKIADQQVALFNQLLSI
nr:glycosyltransferase [uncultured Carboxylicivirga sp.]